MRDIVMRLLQNYTFIVLKNSFNVFLEDLFGCRSHVSKYRFDRNFAID